MHLQLHGIQLLLKISLLWVASLSLDSLRVGGDLQSTILNFRATSKHTCDIECNCLFARLQFHNTNVKGVRSVILKISYNSPFNFFYKLNFIDFNCKIILIDNQNN